MTRATSAQLIQLADDLAAICRRLKNVGFEDIGYVEQIIASLENKAGALLVHETRIYTSRDLTGPGHAGRQT